MQAHVNTASTKDRSDWPDELNDWQWHVLRHATKGGWASYVSGHGSVKKLLAARVRNTQASTCKVPTAQYLSGHSEGAESIPARGSDTCVRGTTQKQTVAQGSRGCSSYKQQRHKATRPA